MTIQVSLPQDLELLLQAQVDKGFYSSISDVVKEALKDFFLTPPSFSAEQRQWIQQEIGPRLEAVKNGSEPLTDMDTVFDQLIYKYS